jgi:hypothetical protein
VSGVYCDFSAALQNEAIIKLFLMIIWLTASTILTRRRKRLQAIFLIIAAMQAFIKAPEVYEPLWESIQLVLEVAATGLSVWAFSKNLPCHRHRTLLALVYLGIVLLFVISRLIHASGILARICAAG